MRDHTRRLTGAGATIALALTGCTAQEPNSIPTTPAPPTAVVELVGPGTVSNPDADEWIFTLLPDGNTMYFQQGGRTDRSYTVLESTFDGREWTAPKTAPFARPLGTGVTDSDPTVSPDGQTVVFTNKDSGSMDLLTATRQGDGWSAPQRLPAPVNSPADETQSSLSAKGTLLFESNRRDGAGQADLWISTGPDFGTVTHLPDSINTPAYEASPFLAPDERFLLFTRDAIPHISVRQGTGWGPPERIDIPGFTGVKRYILSLRITADEQWLYFTSEGEKSQDVFRVRLDAIGLKLPTKP